MGLPPSKTRHHSRFRTAKEYFLELARYRAEKKLISEKMGGELRLLMAHHEKFLQRIIKDISENPKKLSLKEQAAALGFSIPQLLKFWSQVKFPRKKVEEVLGNPRLSDGQKALLLKMPSLLYERFKAEKNIPLRKKKRQNKK